jgi:glycosyltransferase involved in cell wall biosynthesis
LSIVICTYNRADLVRDAIASVVEQDFPRDEYELLVVDNASIDHTCEMVQEFCAAYPNVRYLLETNVGLSRARNRGWREAWGDYVGFLDDDCKVPHEWLSVAVEIVLKKHPDAFGGPYYAFYSTPKPTWFKDEYESYVPSLKAHLLKAGEFLVGGNMFIRRTLLAELSGFSPSFGMSGKTIAYGEETYFFKRMKAQNPNAVMYYEPRLFVYHLVRPEKMNLWTAPRRFFASGRAYYRIVAPEAKPTLTGAGKDIVRLLVQMIIACTWGMITRNRIEYPFKQNYIYEKCLRRVGEVGMAFQALGRVFGKQ